jgi:hypothetical protein
VCFAFKIKTNFDHQVNAKSNKKEWTQEFLIRSCGIESAFLANTLTTNELQTTICNFRKNGKVFEALGIMQS